MVENHALLPLMTTTLSVGTHCPASWGKLAVHWFELDLGVLTETMHSLYQPVPDCLKYLGKDQAVQCIYRHSALVSENIPPWIQPRLGTACLKQLLDLLQIGRASCRESV